MCVDACERVHLLSSAVCVHVLVRETVVMRVPFFLCVSAPLCLLMRVPDARAPCACCGAQFHLPNEGEAPAGLARPVPQLGGAVRRRACLAPIGSAAACVAQGQRPWLARTGWPCGARSDAAEPRAAGRMRARRRRRAGPQGCVQHGHRDIAAGGGRLAQPEASVRAALAHAVLHRAPLCGWRHDAHRPRFAAVWAAAAPPSVAAMYLS